MKVLEEILGKFLYYFGMGTTFLTMNQSPEPSKTDQFNYKK
jgi:hypothetical protein